MKDYGHTRPCNRKLVNSGGDGRPITVPAEAMPAISITHNCHLLDGFGSLLAL